MESKNNMQIELNLPEAINKIENSKDTDKEAIKYLLELSNKVDIKFLHDKAYEVKSRYVGTKVYFRGLIEFSNICLKNCYYCGVRLDNKKVQRYQMSEDEAVKAAIWAYENKFGSIVIQAGERTDKKFIDLIERIIKRIKKESNSQLGITLSLGEQETDTYKRWYDAGAHRYLLRIETSNEELYKKLHPADHSFSKRKECLENIKKIGYQTGTGIMIGLPYQTIDDLVNDIIFFKEFDIDMIGMGPYIVHNDTPLSKEFENFNKIKEYQLELALKMIAVVRILLKNVNLAATTALQALNPTGRELGLLAGANIIMPNITEVQYRPFYQLYEDKPCINEGYGECNSCLQRRIEFLGETIGYGEWGDSLHFKDRINPE